MRMPKSLSKPEVEMESPSGKFEKDRKRLAISEKGAEDGSDLSNYLFSEGEYLGRSPGSWLKLSLYSIIFTACLVAYWGLCLGAFFQTLDNYTPKLQASITSNALRSPTSFLMSSMKETTRLNLIPSRLILHSSVTILALAIGR